MKYLILIITLLLLIVSKKSEKKASKKIVILISFLLLIMYSGFREYILPHNQIGTDYFSYVKWFYIQYGSSIDSFFNMGFDLIIKTIQLFNENYIFMFIISSFIIIGGVFKFSYDNSEYYELSIYIFIAFSLLFSSFNAIRQWMACSIILAGYTFIKEKRFFKYALCVTIASTFHSSAVILILLYPICNLKIKMMYKIIIAILVMIVGSSPDIVTKILNFFSVFDETYSNRYLLNNNTSQANYVVFAVSFTNLFIILLSYKKYIKENLDHNIEINCLIILVITSFLAPLHIIYNRIFIYFLPILLLTVPNIIKIFDNKNTKKVVYILIVVLFFITYI